MQDTEERRRAEINYTARAIKHYYRQRKAAIMGRRYNPDKRNDRQDVWEKAAKLCMELGADPAVFVNTAFDNCKLTTGPFPNMMTGKAMRSWYENNISVALLDSETRDQYGKMAPAVSELKNYVSEAVYYIIQFQNSIKITDELIHQFKMDFTLREPIKVLLTWPDKRMADFFRTEALEVFNNRPDLVKAAELLDFDIQNLLEYLRNG